MNTEHKFGRFDFESFGEHALLCKGLPDSCRLTAHVVIARAALFASAPETAAELERVKAVNRELLHELEWIASYPERHNMTGGGDNGHREMAQIARAALAKQGGVK